MVLGGVCCSAGAIQWASTQEQQNVTPLSLSCTALRPEHGQPRRNQRQGQCLSPLQHSHTRTHSTPPSLHTHAHSRAAMGWVDSQLFPHHRGSIKCLVHACCSHVTLTDSRMNDLFGGAFQLSEMDGINRGFVLADESGDLPL